ncbi:MAG: hypothetical protein COU10_01885 [Candidatus Harrisonbacteria bacterium CG10_big_fil_rev_8_21_14_0_10_45_28]|uniref:AB hydrolase-1 domain-containing protein n=1 Tax=Candidatus Harrisonbacteria bacterium CG10_big_fil_rev_8_21_14_0_10_45_28 TaxID=1974586 RepID=A0A2H0UNE0_9BACT|nr:MAG: hypothetical protein COU10_01885 [Candidatus Harrisonbacteria bacterium CG10_big_fil_rev_8_21_14_0_10_45_28]
MPKQILIIHGGNTFPSHGAYLKHLENSPLDLEGLKRRQSWKSTLQEKLGPDFEVLQPRMPGSDDAVYGQWQTLFNRIIPLLNEEVILIGHSLGGAFLAKYLVENDFYKKITALILIAAPTNEELEPLGEFKPRRTFRALNRKAEKIYLLYSQDDPVVPISNLKEFQENIEKAKTIIFEDKGHFNQEEFPELVKLIQSI